MNCFSFQTRFVEPILGGIKDQTIRAPRKVPPKIGGVMHLFTGMRTKACKRIATVTCTEILKIDISPFYFRGYVWLGANDNATTLSSEPELQAFARRDGFSSSEEMCDFWQASHGALLFRGEVYRWEALAPGAE